MTAVVRASVRSAAREVAAALAGAAPELLPAFHAALPAATVEVYRKLHAALAREHLTRDAVTDALAAEIVDAVVNLAVARARRGRADDDLRMLGSGLGVTDVIGLARRMRELDATFEPTVFFERFSTGGHNLHPCARTRLGWTLPDVLRHDLEATTPTSVVLVGVPRDRTVCSPDAAGRDVGAVLLDRFPHLRGPVAAAGVRAAGHVLMPVHRWQLDRIAGRRELVPVPGAAIRAEPTMSIRTLLTEPDATGRRLFVKTSLDIQITSTRRTISVATTHNGPLVSRLLTDLLDGDPALRGRTLILPEVAGASLSDSSLSDAGDRRVAALVRDGLAERLAPDELAVPGCALYATSPLTGRTVLAELVGRHPAGAAAFLDAYAELLLTPVLRLATRYGIGLEAHLQNCVPTFVDRIPYRLAFRDFGGVRIHRPRLARAGIPLALWPGSVTVTDDVSAMRAKVAYTAVLNHLGEVVARLEVPDAWRRVRDVVLRVFAPLLADPATAQDAAADLAALLAPTLPHKALVSMRLADSGDQYVEVPNPLATR